MASGIRGNVMETTSVSSLRKREREGGKKAIRKTETTKSIPGIKYEANTSEA